MLAMVRGQAPLWVSGGWADRARLPEEMMGNHQTAATRAYKLDPARFGEYAQAAFAQTDAYVASLTDADLDREVRPERDRSRQDATGAVPDRVRHRQHVRPYRGDPGAQGTTVREGLPVLGTDLSGRG